MANSIGMYLRSNKVANYTSTIEQFTDLNITGAIILKILAVFDINGKNKSSPFC